MICRNYLDMLEGIVSTRCSVCYRTISMYLRDCALDKRIVVVNGLDNVAAELRRIGNNLNQLTRDVNAGYVNDVNLTETREEVKAVWQLLNSLLRDAR